MILHAYRAELQDECSPEEAASYCATMPERYWKHVEPQALRWHLSAVRAFFEHVAGAEATTTSPILRWRQRPESDLTEVAVVSWDRPALLMNIAGALSRAGFDILAADAYTREDQLAFDLFTIRSVDGRPDLHDVRLRYASRLLSAFMAVPAPHSTPPVTVEEGPAEREAGTAVSFDNSAEGGTVLRVEAGDRPGLLYLILEALVDCGVSVEQATVSTDGRAKDLFVVADAASGKRLEDPERLAAIEARVREALATHFEFEPAVWGVDPLDLVDGAATLAPP